MSVRSDQLETDYGTEILEELTGETLTKKGQFVRLLDTSVRSSESYYPDGSNGKPRIYNHQTRETLFPIEAYRRIHNVDWKTAFSELSQRYLGGSQMGSNRIGYGRRAKPVIIPPKPPVSYHDQALVDSTLGHYERNDFAIYLRRLFGVSKADELLAQFRVGTGDYWHVSPWWPRAAIFWQVDLQGRVRDGKIINYSAATGKRLKGENPQEHRPRWVHEFAEFTRQHFEQCLFGLQQLTDQPATKPIAVVESEKTAVICTAIMPGFIWLATGGSGNLTPERCKVLAGRSVTLFPDLKVFSEWEKKAEEISKVVVGSVSVSPILEKQATILERDAGLDLADFMTRYRCPDTGPGT